MVDSLLLLPSLASWCIVPPMGTHYPILPIDRTIWEAALTPPEYFESLTSHRRLVRELYGELAIEREDAELLIGALFAPSDVKAEESDRRELFALAMTADWCGDSAHVLPYIARLAETIRLPLRILRRREQEQLAAWYRDQGTEPIPVVSVGTIDEGRFVELARWVERPQAAADRVEAWRQSNPRFVSLAGHQRTEEEEREFKGLYARLLHEMKKWYRDEGLWRTIAQELAAALAPGQE